MIHEMPHFQRARPILSERRRIEIDYCPACRGIWRDRGELDKISEKSSEPGTARAVAGEAPRPVAESYYDGH